MNRRRPYRIRGPQTWALIREGYLNGASAGALADRFDVTEGAIRKRVIREGWGKHATADVLAPAPPPLPPVFPTPPGEAKPSIDDSRQVAAEAVAAARRCMAQGRLDEAAGFSRIAEMLARVAKAADA